MTTTMPGKRSGRPSQGSEDQVFAAAESFPGEFTVEELRGRLRKGAHSIRGMIAILLDKGRLTRLKRGVYCVAGREPIEAAGPAMEAVRSYGETFEARKRELGIFVEAKPEIHATTGRWE